MSAMPGFDEQLEKYAHQGKFHDIVRLLEQKLPVIHSSQEISKLKSQLAEAHYQTRDFQKARSLAEELLE
ncbi:MAG: hypothetical protein ACFFGZ_08920, partial [Candidatus Thorarchaeota archaeon]